MCSSIAHISVIQAGSTPLYIASQCGHTDVVDTLIRAGVSVNQACEVWRLLYIVTACAVNCHLLSSESHVHSHWQSNTSCHFHIWFRYNVCIILYII